MSQFAPFHDRLVAIESSARPQPHRCCSSGSCPYSRAENALSCHLGDGRDKVIVMVRLQISSSGGPVDVDHYQDGDLARVRWLSEDRLRMMLACQGSKTATISTSQPIEFSVGDWILVDEDGSRIWPIDEAAWPRDTNVAVIKLLGEDLVIMEVGSEQKIVEVAQTVDFEAGNTVEVDADGKVLRVLSADPIRYLDSHTVSDAVVKTFRTGAKESNGPSFDDFGGYPEVISRARELIETPLEHHEKLARIGARPIKGVLFTGQPGTGKTLLARIIAARSGATFYEVSGPEIFSKWYGQSEELLRRIFEDAAVHGPAIIFFDEIDSVAGQRDEDAHEASKRVVAQLLTLMDGFTAEQNVVVIAATNRPNDIDVALRRPGRFDWEIDFPLPTDSDRLAILETSSRKLTTRGNLPHMYIAENTPNWSGAELAAVWTEAALLAVRDNRDVILEEDYVGGWQRVASQKLRLNAEHKGTNS